MAKKEFDVGAKLRKLADDKFLCEGMYIISLDGENSSAEIITESEENTIFPLITETSKPEVGIYPGILKYMKKNLDDENMSINHALRMLNNEYLGSQFSIDFNIAENSNYLIKEEKEELPSKEENLKHFDAETLSKDIKSKIIGQDQVVDKAITTILYNQNLRKLGYDLSKIRLLKKNMLIMGKTGTGKTEIIRQIASSLDIPCVVEDATKFTMEGYVGRSTTDMLIDLYERSGRDLQKAEQGILVIDEIDKKSGKEEKGVATTGVQQSLLKIIEGGDFSFNDSLLKKGNNLIFNTSSLTIFLLGAFQEIDKNKEKVIGFTHDISLEDKSYIGDKLIEYGLIPELVGRLTYIAKTNDLKHEDFVNIIKNSKISFLNLIADYYKKLGIEFNYNDDFVNYLAKKAKDKNLGARGIKIALEEILSDVEFDLLTGNVKELDLQTDFSKKIRK